MNQSSCPQCNHQVKGNVRQCVMCGATMEYNAANSDKRDCPRCKVSLELHHYNQFELDQCTECEGIWVESDDFATLTTEFDVYRDQKSDPKYMKPKMSRAEGYLPCACCNKLMTRQNFKKVSGIVIDTCNTCGVWFDKNELQLLRNFIASGGLDKAQDVQIGYNKRDIEAVSDRVSDLELMNKLMHKRSLKRIFFQGY